MQPEIALLMSTYQRPEHLRRALLSVALQQGVAGKMELVVTDDGSTDETPRIIDDFARKVDFPVRMTTHPHTTFCLARCRNEGVAVSTAPYLLFLDGDCLLPADHVRVHLQRRKPNVVMAGDCCRLDRDISDRVSDTVVQGGAFVHWGSPSENRRLEKLDRKSRLYRLLRHPTKPKLIGNNVGMWRADYVRVNGYDENFQGWGGEDDDLRYRLRQAGIKIESILRWTRTFHLWHPIDSTAGATWKEGPNVPYLLRKGRLTRCRNGLVKRDLGDLTIRVVGEPAARDRLEGLDDLIHGPGKNPGSERPEVEIVCLPGKGAFSGKAECNVLVTLDDSPTPPRLARHADVLVSPRIYRDLNDCRQFLVSELRSALEAAA